MLKEAFEENGIKNPLLFAEDGVELMQLLVENGQKKNPGLILLDLNMPRKDGREVLKEIKSNKVLKHIPVIIFTTSRSDPELMCSYNDGAKSFISKPNSYDKLLEIVKSTHDFWFKTVKVPELDV